MTRVNSSANAPVKNKIKNPSVTNRQTCTSSKKYSVDFQRLTQIRKNIFRPPPSLLTPQNLNFCRNLLCSNNLPPNAFSPPTSPIYGETNFLPDNRKSKYDSSSAHHESRITQHATRNTHHHLSSEALLAKGVTPSPHFLTHHALQTPDNSR